MVGDFLGDTGGFRPLCQHLVYVGFGNQPVEHPAVVRGIAAFRQPFHRLRGKGQEYRGGGLLHHDRGAPLFPVFGKVTPAECVNVTEPQSAITGEKIGTFHVLPRTLRRYKGLYLVNGKELALAFRHLDALGRGERHERVFGNDVSPDRRVQCRAEIADIIRHAFRAERIAPCGSVFGLEPADEGDTEVLVDVTHSHLVLPYIGGNEIGHRTQQLHASHAPALLFLVECPHPVRQQHL